ncbi:gag-pol fusion protein [Pelomyxa schiedti]|nr:gag-pol fusion protein [Pelomyxa schiedti]
MYEDVKEWIASCTVCEQQRRSRASFQPKSIIARYPGEYVAIDMFGPLPQTRKGRTEGLVMVDLYSKVVRVCTLKNKEPGTIIKAFEKHWIRMQSCPKNIISDRDPSFIGEFCQQFYTAWGIKSLPTTSYHPQSNGAAENAVKTVKACIEKFCQADPHTWDQNLHWVEMDINNTMSALTGETPFFIDHGRDPVVPFDLATGATPLPEPQSDYMMMLMEQRKNVAEAVKVHQEAEKARQRLSMKRRLAKKKAEMEVGTQSAGKAHRVDKDTGFWKISDFPYSACGKVEASQGE